MADDKPWKWWISGFAIPISMFTVAVIALFISYLNYSKDIAQERAKIDAEYAGKLTALAETVEKQKKLIEDRDRVIEKQKIELDKFTPTQPASPRPFSGTDVSKYLLKDLVEPPKKSWTDRVTEFIASNWKALLPLLVILAAAALSGSQQAKPQSDREVEVS